jgi:hypothetical protein
MKTGFQLSENGFLATDAKALERFRKMYIVCTVCLGDKIISSYVQDTDGNWSIQDRTCSHCHGAGEVYDPNSTLGDGKDKSPG